jgi:hypothetical protein
MRRVPAILIVLFLVVPLLSAAFLTVGISTWALDRTFYAGLISDERLYQIPDAVSSATWGDIDIPGFMRFSFPSSVKAAREVLPPAYLEGQAVHAVGQVFDFLEGDNRPLDISLDLKPVKNALLGDPGKRFARILAQELPVGGTASDFTVRPGRLPSSRPSTISVDKAAAIIQAGIPAYVKAMPDTLRLSDDPSYHFVPRPWGMWQGFPALGALVLADVILLLLAGGFLVAAVFIGSANRFERLQWAGWPLLVPAVGTFLVGLFITLVAFSGWVPWGIESARLQTAGYDSGFIAALVGVARHAMTRVGVGFIATGAVAAAVAMGLLGWSWSIPQESRKGAEA